MNDGRTMASVSDREEDEDRALIWDQASGSSGSRLQPVAGLCRSLRVCRYYARRAIREGFTTTVVFSVREKNTSRTIAIIRVCIYSY